MQQLQKATRKKVKIKVGMQGSAGSGKTIGALLLAYGITKDWNKIAVIDTENESASLYVNRELPTGDVIGEFQTLPLKSPYDPETCIEAINVCIKDPSVDVIIFDSISHEWNGRGGILDIHEQMGKMNDMLKWSKLTPRHNKFVDAILQAPKHMVLCMRSKQDYVMKEQANSQGKMVLIPEKVGLKAVTKDGVDYEFTLNFDIDINNFATAVKDRTALFKGKPEFKITPKTGGTIIEWCETGVEVKQPEPLPINNQAADFYPTWQKEVDSMDTATKLRQLYDVHAATVSEDEKLKAMFKTKQGTFKNVAV